MGDSDFGFYLFVAALLVMVGAIVAFVIAWRSRQRAVRVAVGVILLAVAAVCPVLSVLVAFLVGALGVSALVLASKAPQTKSLEVDGPTDQ
ncbi:MAG: hypothetical protein PVJ43_10515 [Gemmatimonadales bacterium]|jgi:hypothetical protein